MNHPIVHSALHTATADLQLTRELNHIDVCLFQSQPHLDYTSVESLLVCMLAPLVSSQIEIVASDTDSPGKG